LPLQSFAVSSQEWIIAKYAILLASFCESCDVTVEPTF